jgi:4-hydroxythreonine-4-phosphate dehydrogenase
MLKELTNSKKVVMMLYGEKLKVALLTIHKPIIEVSKNITFDHFIETVKIINSEMIDKFKIKNPSIGVLGLNPHAGENGKLGKEEINIYIPAIKKLKEIGINIEGPYPADTYFYKTYKKFDVTLASYHDQGLIPLKMLHFDDGVNITLGVNIIRTSVDHGTAYDIADTMVASEKSLINAIKEAFRIASEKSL